MHQCIKFILFWNDTLHVSEGLSVHHQEFKTVRTARGICQTDTAVCLLASRQQWFTVWCAVWCAVWCTVWCAVWCAIWCTVWCAVWCAVRCTVSADPKYPGAYVNISVRPTDSRTKKHNTYQLFYIYIYIYIYSIPPDNGLQIRPKHVESD